MKYRKILIFICAIIVCIGMMVAKPIDTKAMSYTVCGCPVRYILWWDGTTPQAWTKDSYKMLSDYPYACATVWEYRDREGTDQIAYFKCKEENKFKEAKAIGKHSFLKNGLVSAKGRHFFASMPGGQGKLTTKYTSPVKYIYVGY